MLQAKKKKGDVSESLHHVCVCVCVGCQNLPPYGLFYQVTQRIALPGDRDARRRLIHLHICSEDGREGGRVGWRGGRLSEMQKMQISV